NFTQSAAASRLAVTARGDSDANREFEEQSRRERGWTCAFQVEPELGARAKADRRGVACEPVPLRWGGVPRLELAGPRRRPQAWSGHRGQDQGLSGARHRELGHRRRQGGAQRSRRRNGRSLELPPFDGGNGATRSDQCRWRGHWGLRPELDEVISSDER